MLTSRPPIVVILGHVDHGKTTLLDHLHKSHIAAREAGGITQSIRSFQLATCLPAGKANNQQLITFIDTPGHEAFSHMRRRGSVIADLAVLLVAADDGVQPQTKQSLKFIEESGIPFIVALNKTDLKTADPDRVKTQLAEAGALVEELGGQVPSVAISAKTGQGIDSLLELIQLLVELNPPQADPEAALEAIVLESKLDSQKGPLAIVIIKNGTLRVGDQLYQDQLAGKVKSILDSDGEVLKFALPSQPVEILGLTSVLSVGSTISNQSNLLNKKIVSPPRSEGDLGVVSDKKLNLILKADVAGSLEAILANLDPQVHVVSSGTGEIVENDILLAVTSHAQVVGFNLKPSGSIQKLAETEKVTLKTFPIIYELFQYLNKLLHPKITIQIVGKAKILADFKIEAQRIAGCRCTEGLIDKSTQIQILRQDKIIGQVRIKSLQQGKNPLEKAKTGIEFGAVFSPFIDFKVGDDIIATTG